MKVHQSHISIEGYVSMLDRILAATLKAARETTYLQAQCIARPGNMSWQSGLPVEVKNVILYKSYHSY